ncbi:hypothetical protein [Methylobacterium radiodurans]|uniref:hypothetical protein n=1 Tax=Methylobacterium radiodurans TaxID=2202828 RepID=UPI00195092F0|nr:hypothetical protein [Methylobacterium radiodurans]
MQIWLTSALSLWAAYWAAIFAELAHLRRREDGVGASACARIAGSLLAIGLSLFLLARI